MLQASRGADLILESAGTEHGTELGMEHFERDRTIVLEVVGEVDRGHAPAPECALELVPVGKAGLKAGLEFGQGDLSVFWGRPMLLPELLGG